ncbi:MAG: hypothetical protein NTV86_20465 [Planctomycetota bacterium]|nr:hypothetical protein [Planctomycetota bacterium]
MKNYGLILGLAAVCVTGCGQYGMDMPRMPAVSMPPAAGYVKPTVAVMRFNCNTSTPGNWNLGDGLRDVLADRLVASGRFRVIERPELSAVADEVQLQQNGQTRQQQRVTPGRFKNVQYLVKGTVVDFGHAEVSKSFVDWAQRFQAMGATQRAVVSVTLQVVDVESGEIISSEFLEESVPAHTVAAQAGYKDVAFGGSVFWRKPLGEAMSHVVDKCVRRVSTSVASAPWTPRVAGVQDAQVLINGGWDRRVKLGTQLEVFEAGGKIIDPDTGDVIGSHPGKPVGRVLITQVYPHYSVSRLISGEASSIEYGQRCASARKLPPASASSAVVAATPRQ